ncbi:MAG: zinc transporter ZntB, partial [Gammaproteobacteria bacterium]|nr:zinc transporter ZntB [Gammaproteobacteria bacterium]
MNAEHDMDSRGLVCAYTLDGRGAGRFIDWPEIEAPPAPGECRWIHVDFTSDNAREWVRERAGVDRIVAEALLADDSRPRAIDYDDGLLVTLRGMNKNPGADPEDMISIRLWLTKDRILSTRRRRLLSVRSIRDDIEAGHGPADPAAFLLLLIDKLGDRVSPVIDELDEDLERAEEQVESESKLTYTSEFTSLRRQAVRIRRFLAPQRDGFERLSRQKSALLTDDQRFQLREEADRLTRFLEDLDLVRERAMVAQEELLAKYAQEQNSRMYILAIVAALFLPLSFLTGLMGMNVAGLPGTEDSRAFAMLVLLMCGCAAG